MRQDLFLEFVRDAIVQEGRAIFYLFIYSILNNITINRSERWGL